MYGIIAIILLIAWARGLDLGFPGWLVNSFLVEAVIMTTAHYSSSWVRLKILSQILTKRILQTILILKLWIRTHRPGPNRFTAAPK